MVLAAMGMRAILCAVLLAQVGQEQPPETDPLIGKSNDTNETRSEWTERANHHIPDPIVAIEQAQQELEQATRSTDIEPLKELIQRLRMVQRPEKLDLTLEHALHRALEHNFAIRVSSYNPAIDTTRVVEAEAAFDASLFMTLQNNKINQPVASAIAGSNIQQFDVESGIRKLLPTGMQVQASYAVNRTFNSFAFQQINPSWSNNFIVQFQQPLLRGFGVDYNRSQIRIQKLNRQQSMEAFKREIRDTLRSTEEAYWRLVQARRLLVINAKLLASFEQIYNFLYERRDFDVYRIQLSDTKARLERQKANFVQLLANVRDAEDRLIAQMNDPTIDLADDIEIVPKISPVLHKVVIDRLGEVQTALDNRAEIAEAQIGIKSAQIQIGVAKNQAMPQVDLSFRMEVAGLGESNDDAFDEVTKNDFHRYIVGINFELPIGNRARRAAVRRARLQHAQSLASLKQVIEQVILDVNVAVRAVQTEYDQIEPNLQSAQATEDQVDSIIARAEKKDFLTLNNELNTRQSLASARATLLESLVNYNLAIIDLERARGTLLKYNGIELDIDTTDPSGATTVP